MGETSLDGYDVRASVDVDARPREVFAFLADLENHWLIADRMVDVVELSGPAGARTGGRVAVRGPLGITRLASTQVRSTRPPTDICGSAQLGDRTRATVRWRLEPDGSGTRVTLAARVDRASCGDRILWTLGGRLWIRRRFAATLDGLRRRFAAPVTSRPTG